jgi:UDP-N-acetylmuramoyl-L-alanyl-D-glutamate--2,6-diaminopimelate ligase
MKLSALLSDISGLDDVAASLDINGLSSSSSECKSGNLFFGLPGVNTDGAKYASDAVANGAIAVVVGAKSDVSKLSVPVIRVDDPRDMLAHAAAKFYGKQPHLMAAVTGTAGKTSVATFLRQIWEAEKRVAASLGTTGVVAPGRDDYGNLTTPDPISLHRLLAELADGGVTHASMEASSHGLDQKRLAGVSLTVAGFTNLGRDHMDYHSTIEEYLDAKMILFRDLLPMDKPAVIYSDDGYSEHAMKAASAAGRKVLSVGRKGDYISLKKVEHHQFNQVLELEHAGEYFRVEFPLAGDFQVANALVASGMALACGSNPAIVFKSLETLKGASGRLELVGRTTNGAPAYVDYAHKPEALENVLSSLRPFTSGKIILVFGCGGDRDKGKRPIMGEIASRLSDVVIVTDDNPRTEDAALVRSEIIAACPDAIEIGDRSKAIHHACDLLSEGDCLVVAGKGHELGQIVGDTVLPFSDHEVLRQAMGVSAS